MRCLASSYKVSVYQRDGLHPRAAHRRPRAPMLLDVQKGASNAVVHGDAFDNPQVGNVRPFGLGPVVGPAKVHDQVHQFPRQGHF